MSLADPLRQIGAGALGLARQRLELAALDIEEEMLRAGTLLAALLVAVLLGTLAVATAIALVVVLFWDTARVAALATCFLALAAGTAFVMWRLTQALRTKPPLLATTLAELDKDAASFREAR
ncbi:MAG: phage holin family protein [Pseudomonadota bacterium]